MGVVGGIDDNVSGITTRNDIVGAADGILSCGDVGVVVGDKLGVAVDAIVSIGVAGDALDGDNKGDGLLEGVTVSIVDGAIGVDGDPDGKDEGLVAGIIDGERGGEADGLIVGDRLGSVDGLDCTGADVGDLDSDTMLIM